MQLVCDIPDKLYRKWEVSKFSLQESLEFVRCVINGTPLPYHGRLVDVDKSVHVQIYDDEHEEYIDKEMTLAEYIDSFTDEGVVTVLETTKGEEDASHN